MHVVVTGASGFVGQSLVRRLLFCGHRVTCLGRPGSPLIPGTEQIEYSLGSAAPLVFPPAVDAVAHLAQSRNYRQFPDDVATMFAVNVNGAQQVLSAAAARGISRFCLVSSGTIYEPYAGNLDESACPHPTSYLGATKLAAETLARPFAAVFPLSVLRLFTPYGPGQTARVIPDLIRRVSRGEPVTLPLAGAGMRFSPTYVEDIAEVIETALRDGWNETLNVASPERLTVEEAAHQIGHALGRQPMFERRSVAAPQITPCLEKLRRKYDLGKFRPFAAGIKSTLDELSQVSAQGRSLLFQA